jgi:hypothetical protein
LEGERFCGLTKPRLRARRQANPEPGKIEKSALAFGEQPGAEGLQKEKPSGNTTPNHRLRQ